MADWVSTYGFEPGQRLTPEQRIGLYLNQDRVNIRISHRIRDGVMAAFAKNLDLSWFDAISKTPEEAAFLKAQFERMNEGSE